MCLKHRSDFSFLCKVKVKHDLGLKLAKNDLFLTVVYIICTRVCVFTPIFSGHVAWSPSSLLRIEVLMKSETEL